VTETRKGVLGEEHPDTLTSMANLASTNWNQNQWTQAEELFVQVMKTRKRVLREEHPSTLTSMNNLAHNAGPTMARRVLMIRNAQVPSWEGLPQAIVFDQRYLFL